MSIIIDKNIVSRETGPYLIGSTPEHKIVQWSKASHDFFYELWKNGLAEEVGVTMVPIYRLTTESECQQDPCWKNIVFGFKVLDENELRLLGTEHGRNYTAGNHFITFCVEPTRFLPYLFKRFEKVYLSFFNIKIKKDF